MNERILVTGGAGFIGSHLVDRLVAEGHAVTVLDTFATGSPDNLIDASASGDVRIVTGSVLNSLDLDDAINDCRMVFHMAVECVRRSIGKPLDNHETNATGTLNTLEAARRAGIDRFIYCSSSEVYGNAGVGQLNEENTVCRPVTVYGAAKLVGEHYALAYHQTYGMDAVVVRPFNAYGPREHHQGDLAEVVPRFAIRTLNGLPPVIFGTGENARDFTYVTEVAEGLFRASLSSDLVGKAVNIAFGESVSVARLAQLIAVACQRRDLEPQFIDARPGDVLHLHADIDRAANTLGFRPRIAVEEGIECYLSWLIETYPDPAELLDSQIVNWSLPA